MVNYDLKAVQQCELEIFREIQRVCEENSIRYCLAFGSCLGAIRHKGFIPWDDDIDVFMPYEDFCKFNKMNKKIKEPFFIQTFETDPQYGLMITRVRNSNTTYIEAAENHRDINHGVFVDIYPLFCSPKGKLKNAWQTINAYLYRLALYGEPPKNHGKIIRILGDLVLKVLPKGLRKFNIRQMTKYSEGELVSELYARPSARYPRDLFFPARLTEFEGAQAPVPKKAERFLALHYGSNFMELPPENQRNIHLVRKVGNVTQHVISCIDLERSYKDYKGKYYCTEMVNNSGRKTV